MSRSVVYAGTARCERCLLPPRWCVCAGSAEVPCPLTVDILMHQREQWRPTSTGKLIQRVVPGVRTHVLLKDRPLERSEVLRLGKPLWILHPRGEELVAGSDLARGALDAQILLLDGSWGEASTMLKLTEGWGRPVSVRLSGRSRYWLREQQGDGHHSTIEALLGVFATLGMTEAEAVLRRNFELHVYASLRGRGHKIQAAEYLAGSPIRADLREFLSSLNERRPNESSMPGYQAKPWNGWAEQRRAMIQAGPGESSSETGE